MRIRIVLLAGLLAAAGCGKSEEAPTTVTTEMEAQQQKTHDQVQEDERKWQAQQPRPE